MHICSLDSGNICPDNFDIQLERLWPGIGKAAEQDYLGIACVGVVGRGKGSHIRKHNKQQTESWRVQPTQWKTDGYV